jgi:hypothetical protein
VIGDIILQKRSGWLGWIVSRFTRSDYVHVGIDNGWAGIVHVDWRGKRTSTYKEWGDDIIVLRYRVPLSQKQQVDLIDAMRSIQVKGYDFWSAVKSWLWWNTNDNKPTGNYYQCAEFVCRCYREIGIDLIPNRSDDTTQPQEFLESLVLQRKAA